MDTVTQLPTWAVYLASVGTPVSAFLAVLFGNWVTRRGQKETELRARRDRVMDTLQWAAELAVEKDAAKAELGVVQLKTLAQSNLNDDDVQKFVEAALETVVDDVADRIEQTESDGVAVRVIRIANWDPNVRYAVGPMPVSSKDPSEDEGDPA